MKNIALTLMALVAGVTGFLLITPAFTTPAASTVYRPLLRAATPLITLPTTQGSKPVTIYVAEPSIGSLQAQGFLLTASYVVTASVGVEREAMFGLWNGERVTLDATSAVYAGVDMAQTTYEASTRTLTLPPSQLGPVDVDEAATNLHQQVSVIAPTENDGSLTKTARLEAEARIIQKACRAGLLIQAATIAKQRVEASLKQVGIENVVVVAKAGECE